ncbi:hypothetical protein [Chlorobium limicola]
MLLMRKVFGQAAVLCLLLLGHASCFGVSISSLTAEQRDALLINDFYPQYACPGDTLKLEIKAVTSPYFFPMAETSVDVRTEWQVVPETGITIDQKRGQLVVGRDVQDGTLFTISAKIRKKGNVRDNTLYVYTKKANPFAGYWEEEGGNIEELIIKPDRTFSVTAIPFEIRKDYWGTVSFDLQSGSITFTAEHGNTVPKDIDLNGSFRFDDEGRLVLEGIYFGTLIPGDSFKQKYIFKKTGR